MLPLIQFALAVAVIAGLQWLFYRTALGRAFRATRTRTMRIRHGVLLAIERLVKAEDTEGVRYLITAGAQDCSLEAIVLRHPRLFGAATARQARAKLAWQPPKAA